MKKFDKLAIRQGYIDMANINLSIAQEYFHLETEGAKYYEVDKAEAKGRTN